MKFTNVIVGAIVAAIGAGIGYVDYLIISTIYELSSWVAGLLNAPESLAVVLTLLMSWVFLGLIVVIAVIALWVIISGILLLLD